MSITRVASGWTKQNRASRVTAIPVGEEWLGVTGVFTVRKISEGPQNEGKRSRRRAEEGKEDGRDQPPNLHLNQYSAIFMFYKCWFHMKMTSTPWWEGGESWGRRRGYLKKHMVSFQRLFHYHCRDGLCWGTFPPATILSINLCYLR